MHTPVSRRPRAVVSTLAAAAVAALLTGGCESSGLTPEDSALRPPSVGAPVLSPTHINIDSLPSPGGTADITLDLAVSADDPDGRSTLRSVRADIFRPGAPEPFRTVTLADDGSAPDVTAGDGLFAARTTFTARREQAGRYRIRFSSTDRTGLRSTAREITALLTRTNGAPVLVDSTLTAPDTLDRPSSGSTLFFMSIAAVDPDGLADLDVVFLQNLASLNRTFLRDDGGALSGDRVAGDGVYSVTLQLPSTQPPGTYLFRLQAVDTFGDSSGSVPYALVVR